MDRVSRSMDHDEMGSFKEDQSFMLSGVEGRDPILSEPVHALPKSLFELKQLACEYEADEEVLWTFMEPDGRPSFNPQMLADFVHWQDLISDNFGPDKVPLRYLVLGSRAPGVFCYGGDLELFQRLIRAKDRDALVAYGHRCCEILHRNLRSLDLPIVTIGLVQGAALGGGFEALLSFDYIIAERNATFGLPEILFGLYPGMGAHSLLSRKLGTAMADRLIISSKTYTAEEMHELGLVHELVDVGRGVDAARSFIAKSKRKHAGHVNARKAMAIAQPLELKELTDITELWADTALMLTEVDLKVMNRLATAQSRVAERA